MAVFSQHHVDGLDMSKSPLLYLCHSFPVSWPNEVPDRKEVMRVTDCPSRYPIYQTLLGV